MRIFLPLVCEMTDVSYPRTQSDLIKKAKEHKLHLKTPQPAGERP